MAWRATVWHTSASAASAFLLRVPACATHALTIQSFLSAQISHSCQSVLSLSSGNISLSCSVSPLYSLGPVSYVSSASWFASFLSGPCCHLCCYNDPAYSKFPWQWVVHTGLLSDPVLFYRRAECIFPLGAHMSWIAGLAACEYISLLEHEFRQ